jgi:hypothetical protein
VVSGVYAIRNTLTGSCYVGSATNLRSRFKSHRSALRRHGKAPPKLQQAWDKHGPGAFQFHVLEYCPPEVLLEVEQSYIDELSPKYNTRQVAHSNYGVKWPEEVNAKKGRPEKVYTVNGVTGSIRKLAAHFGVVSDVGARSRIRKGWDAESAFLTPPTPRRERGLKGAAVRKDTRVNDKAGRHLTAFGVTANVRTLCKRFSEHSYRAVLRRLGLGWDIERALTQPLRPRGPSS